MRFASEAVVPAWEQRRGVAARLAAVAPGAVMPALGTLLGAWRSSLEGATCPYRSRRYAYRRGRRVAYRAVVAHGAARATAQWPARLDGAGGAPRMAGVARDGEAMVRIWPSGAAARTDDLPARDVSPLPLEPALSHLRFLRWLCRTGRLVP